MFRARKICCPVDFSETSKAALEMAVDLARQFDAQLTVLHVIEDANPLLPEGRVFVTSDFFQPVLDKANRSLQEWLQLAQSRGKIKIDGQVITGVPFAEILQFVEQGKFDLIVMGTEGRTGLTHLVFGSVAERVLRMAVCPVLVVPNPARVSAQFRRD
jgi:nucleotide-binding universal stress UspA family protein